MYLVPVRHTSTRASKHTELRAVIHFEQELLDVRQQGKVTVVSEINI